MIKALPKQVPYYATYQDMRCLPEPDALEGGVFAVIPKGTRCQLVESGNNKGLYEVLPWDGMSKNAEAFVETQGIYFHEDELDNPENANSSISDAIMARDKDYWGEYWS